MRARLKSKGRRERGEEGGKAAGAVVENGIGIAEKEKEEEEMDVDSDGTDSECSVNLDVDIEISDEAHAENNSYLVKSASAGANGLEFLSPGMNSSVQFKVGCDLQRG